MMLVDRNIAITYKDEILPQDIGDDATIELPHDTVVVWQGKQVALGRHLAIKIALPQVGHLADVVLKADLDPIRLRHCRNWARTAQAGKRSMSTAGCITILLCRVRGSLMPAAQRPSQSSGSSSSGSGIQ